MTSQIYGLSAVLAVACALSGPAFAAGGVQVAALDGNVASVQSAASAPAQVDTGVATGAPKRLSKLSGNDDTAWADAHSLHAVSWHRPMVPLHVSLSQPAKPAPAGKAAPANKVAVEAGKVSAR